MPAPPHQGELPPLRPHPPSRGGRSSSRRPRNRHRPPEEAVQLAGLRRHAGHSPSTSRRSPAPSTHSAQSRCRSVKMWAWPTSPSPPSAATGPASSPAVTGTLLEHEVNIEDSQMAILRGHFTMTLIVSAPELVDLPALRADLERTREQLGLDAITVSRVARRGRRTTSEPSPHRHGLRRRPPGPRPRRRRRARRSATSTSPTSTRASRRPRTATPLYAMMLEVALPPGLVRRGAADAARGRRARAGRRGDRPRARPESRCEVRDVLRCPAPGAQAGAPAPLDDGRGLGSRGCAATCSTRCAPIPALRRARRAADRRARAASSPSTARDHPRRRARRAAPARQPA